MSVPLFLFLTFSLPANATLQIPDSLTYKNQTYQLNTPVPNKQLPLDSLDKKTPLINPIRSREMISSGCWRGYVATWMVEKNVLFITSITTNPENKNVPLKDVFPNSTTTDRVKADWFSGTLVLENKQDRLTLSIREGIILSETKP